MRRIQRSLKVCTRMKKMNDQVSVRVGFQWRVHTTPHTYTLEARTKLCTFMVLRETCLCHAHYIAFGFQIARWVSWWFFLHICQVQVHAVGLWTCVRTPAAQRVSGLEAPYCTMSQTKTRYGSCLLRMRTRDQTKDAGGLKLAT